MGGIGVLLPEVKFLIVVVGSTLMLLLALLVTSVWELQENKNPRGLDNKP